MDRKHYISKVLRFNTLKNLPSLQLANNEMVQYHHHLVASVEGTPKQSTLYQHRKALF